jgi:hypothetical protein
VKNVTKSKQLQKVAESFGDKVDFDATEKQNDEMMSVQI